MDEEDEDEYMDGNYNNRGARNNKNMHLQVKPGAQHERIDNHSGGVENFDDKMLR